VNSSTVPTTSASTASVEHLANRLRRRAIKMIHRAKSSHVGSVFSSVDILAVLYEKILRIDPAQPDWTERDRFILSKGHASAGLYAVLAERGFFPDSWLDEFCLDGGRLAGHATHIGVPGVEVSTGSLGHGLPLACGMALVGKREGRPFRVFTMLSDGECDEGSTWEAVLFAPFHRLDNLIAIVDYNKIQSLGTVKEVLDLDSLAAKWRAFGWSVLEIDGHDFAQIEDALGEVPAQPGRPTCIIAHTIKGKGVSFMENKLLWHYRSPDEGELRLALAELGEA
jgi:transketolase